MRIFCGIDGTGNLDLSPERRPAGLAVLSGSGRRRRSGFVKRIARMGFHARRYFPGTRDAFTGESSTRIIDEARQWILETYHHPGIASTKRQIYLSGFSRGGAAAIVLAHQLRDFDIPVAGMFLFDAVDRSRSLPNAMTLSIPDNVGAAFHAIRAPEVRSRVAFGNCGTRSDCGNLRIAHFATTHGGVGGWLNGRRRVRPGIGIEHAAVLLFPDRAEALSPRMQRNIHELLEPFPTTIDPVQEAKGSREAWMWMRQNARATFTGRPPRGSPSPPRPSGRASASPASPSGNT